jgi:hypothetical protein
MGPRLRGDDERESLMPYPPSAYDAHQRERWTRHDAHLWIRNDFARWLKPGSDPEDVFPHLKRQREAVEDAAFAAQIAASRRFLAELRAEVNELKAALARRRLEEAKYSPSQPRVPAGNPRGGRWTDRSGQSQDQSQSTGLAHPMGIVDVGDVSGSSQLGDLFQITPAEPGTVGVQLAVDGRPVDLLGEEQSDGHAFEKHVGKSERWLLYDVRSIAASATEKGDYFEGFRSGSFTSLEAANKLVNATISAIRARSTKS